MALQTEALLNVTSSTSKAARSKVQETSMPNIANLMICVIKQTNLVLHMTGVGMHCGTDHGEALLAVTAQ